MKLKHLIVFFALSIFTGTTGLIAQVDTAFTEPSFEELLEMNVEDIIMFSGGTGAFGKQLESLNYDIYLHAYSSFWSRNFDFNRRKTNNTFSLHYFNPIIGVNIEDLVVSEAMFEYEHGGSEIEMRYAFVDYNIFKFLTFRFGKFLIPVGNFNEYRIPEHINLFADRPITHWRIIPCVWNDVGIQLRGEYTLNENTSFDYALYVVNGLEQKDGKYGGDIRAMRNNVRDYSNNKKSFGGQLNILPIQNLKIGASYYSGIYSQDGKQNLSLLCFNSEVKLLEFEFRGEYVSAVQDTLLGNIKKEGFFVEAAYKIYPKIQPTIRYEQANLPTIMSLDALNTEKIQRITFGLNYYPIPKIIPRLNFKINYSVILNDGTGVSRNEFILQSAIAF